MLYGFNALMKLSKGSSFDPLHLTPFTEGHRGHEIGKECNQSILIGPVVNITYTDLV